MFAKHDIPIFLAGWALIWGTAFALRPSSLVLHLVTYAVIALAVSAHFIWEDIREEGSFHWRSSRRRGVERGKTATGS